jgi:hypothetical protein
MHTCIHTYNTKYLPTFECELLCIHTYTHTQYIHRYAASSIHTVVPTNMYLVAESHGLQLLQRAGGGLPLHAQAAACLFMRRLDTNSGHDFDGEFAEESGCVSGGIGIGDGDGDRGDGKEEDEDESGSGSSFDLADNEGRDEEREDESGSGGQGAAKEEKDGWGTILP